MSTASPHYSSGDPLIPPIDNSLLLEPLSPSRVDSSPDAASFAATHRLRSGLKEGIDYVLVNREVWETLSGLYGGGPDVYFFVVRDAPQQSGYLHTKGYEKGRFPDKEFRTAAFWDPKRSRREIVPASPRMSSRRFLEFYKRKLMLPNNYCSLATVKTISQDNGMLYRTFNVQIHDLF